MLPLSSPAKAGVVSKWWPPVVRSENSRPDPQTGFMANTQQETCCGLYSSVAERQSCKLKVLGSIPSGGYLLAGRSMQSQFFASPSATHIVGRPEHAEPVLCATMCYPRVSAHGPLTCQSYAPRMLAHIIAVQSHGGLCIGTCGRCLLQGGAAALAESILAAPACGQILHDDRMLRIWLPSASRAQWQSVSLVN